MSTRYARVHERTQAIVTLYNIPINNKIEFTLPGTRLASSVENKRHNIEKYTLIRQINSSLDLSHE